ncbi:uncharacterized protein VDAG_02385 [Verticillium dahliae VdLs.17]|uniref:Uncharacterized protein n=1 Tax=Verticillium dahliae (strain VdLs.17 / ATCC MYA-4575 / FGSC 10137) TaxID=498257 RepID=G2WXQ3_VERDV|nr:uncharacterized protein VDAG_02385 [Verticillium dahliae VdLs.17]EGY20861.1 hypothetical protein VDAG_02385 [Verticillium dahliae VdLs.17]
MLLFHSLCIRQPRGIDLALYVSFPEDGGFVSYESANLSWHQDIEAKVSSLLRSFLLPPLMTSGKPWHLRPFSCKSRRAAGVGSRSWGCRRRHDDGEDDDDEA